MRARWLVVSLVVLVAGDPRAFAQSASVQAQSLFDEGRKLLQAGKLTEACAAFESSHKLDPAITTLLNLADCREQNHQLATAWGTFIDANRMARESSNDKLARVASNHARKLESRLSKLKIYVPADRRVPGLEVLRDGDPVNPAGWNHALPIDGGTYTITARAPGRAPWSQVKTIKVEADEQAVEIPKLEVARPGAPVAAVRAGTQAGSAPSPSPTPAKPASPPVAAVPAGSSPDPVSASSPATPAASPAKPVAVANTGGQEDAMPASPAPAVVDRPEAAPARTLPIVFGAGAIALGGAALGFHLWGNSAYDQAKVSTTQPERDELESSANTRRYFAQGFGVAAIGCAGAAVYLYVRSRGEHRADAVAMTPVASPQFAGLAVIGSW